MIPLLLKWQFNSLLVIVKLLTISVNTVSVWGGLKLREILASDGDDTIPLTLFGKIVDDVEGPENKIKIATIYKSSMSTTIYHVQTTLLK